MNVILVVKKGPARTKSIQLRTEETIIGRSRDCDLCIPSKAVSRRHCLIALSGNKLTVEDLDSANGTFLNGKRVRNKQSVTPGDLLEVGPLTFSVQFQFADPAETGKYEPKKQPGGAAAGDWIPLAESADEQAEGWVVFETEHGDAKAAAQPALDAEVVDVEVADDDPTKPPAKKAPADDEEFDVVLDDCEPLDLPEVADLRDIISKMDK